MAWVKGLGVVFAMAFFVACSVTLLSGCGSTTGWGAGFNVYPIKQVKDVKELEDRRGYQEVRR